MENVLDIYKRPYDPARPVVCMDETPRQLIGQVREPIAASSGRVMREDYEYQRLGVCNVFMACEPLAGRRSTKGTEQKTNGGCAPVFGRHCATVPTGPAHHIGDG